MTTTTDRRDAERKSPGQRAATTGQKSHDERHDSTPGANGKPQDDARPIPHALGIEKSVLSQIFQIPERLALAPQLQPEHFHIPAHRIIFETLCEFVANGEGTDLVMTAQRLLNRGLLDRCGGPAAIGDIYGHEPNPVESRFLQHVGELEFQRTRRDMIEYARDLEAAAYEAAEPEELVAAVKRGDSLADSGRGGANGFLISRASETSGMAAVSDFVEGLLTDGGASVIYGPSNCGKSFWILDLAVSVATGQPFREDLEVDRGAVVYVALEGSFGVRNRIEALKRAGRLPADAPLFFCFAPVSLLERGHAARLAQSVRRAATESAMPCRLVILDTLARAMAGGDENSGEDMTAAVAALDVIRAETGAHVAVIHHSGKDESRGARGHSSLRAAVDTEIEVSRPDGETISTVRVTKQRDLPIGEPMPFSLKVVELGTDRRGKPITSCIVHHEDAIMANARGKAGRKPVATAAEILELLPMPTTAAWRKAAQDEAGISGSTFDRLRREVQGNGAIKTHDGKWISQGVSK